MEVEWESEGEKLVVKEVEVEQGVEEVLECGEELEMAMGMRVVCLAKDGDNKIETVSLIGGEGKSQLVHNSIGLAARGENAVGVVHIDRNAGVVKMMVGEDEVKVVEPCGNGVQLGLATAGDLDLDGIDEVVVTCVGGGKSVAVILTPDITTSTVTTTNLPNPSPSNPFSTPSIFDMNGDGSMDLLIPLLASPPLLFISNPTTTTTTSSYLSIQPKYAPEFDLAVTAAGDPVMCGSLFDIEGWPTAAKCSLGSLGRGVIGGLKGIVEEIPTSVNLTDPVPDVVNQPSTFASITFTTDSDQPPHLSLKRLPLNTILTIHQPPSFAPMTHLDYSSFLVRPCSHVQIASVAPPSHGTAVVLPSKRAILYTPFPGFEGTDKFRYDLSDHTFASITVKVLPSTPAPPITTPASPYHFASYSGGYNNMEHPEWGKAFTPLSRQGPVGYSDLVGAPAGRDRPSPRLVSNELFIQTEDMPDPFGLSDLVVQAGQFIAHDIDFVTPLADFQARGNLAVPVPKGDPMFDPNNTGVETLHFRRSGNMAGTGFTTRKPRTQVNKISSYLDLGPVYGGGRDRALGLRERIGNRLSPRHSLVEPTSTPASSACPFLHSTSSSSNTDALSPLSDMHIRSWPKPMDDALVAQARNRTHRPRRDFVMSEGDELELNSGHLPNLNLLGRRREDLMISGDNRVNVQPGITSMHTLFARLHNREVEEILISDPAMPDELVFELARARARSHYQAATWHDYLLSILGPELMKEELGEYRGYDPNVDPTVTTEFATAAFRFGHSQVGSILRRLDPDWKPSPHGDIHLKTGWFEPEKYRSGGGTDAVIRGSIDLPAQANDAKMVDEVRDFLFFSGVKGFDLAAFNINRGRDHGLADYNSIREAFGLPRIENTVDICPASDTHCQKVLPTLYPNASDIDIFVAGLVEEPYRGAIVGETFATIIIDQFDRLRHGDRYWYENRKEPGVWDVPQSALLTTFVDIIDHVTQVFRPAHSQEAHPRKPRTHLDALYATKTSTQCVKPAPGSSSAQATVLYHYTTDNSTPPLAPGDCETPQSAASCRSAGNQCLKDAYSSLTRGERRLAALRATPHSMIATETLFADENQQ